MEDKKEKSLDLKKQNGNEYPNCKNKKITKNQDDKKKSNSDLIELKNTKIVNKKKNHKKYFFNFFFITLNVLILSFLIFKINILYKDNKLIKKELKFLKNQKKKYFSHF